MKIHGAVRIDDEVYLPENEEHAAMLAERLTDRQKARLSEAGVISGTGSEVSVDENPVAEEAPVQKKATRKGRRLISLLRLRLLQRKRKKLLRRKKKVPPRGMINGYYAC